MLIDFADSGRCFYCLVLRNRLAPKWPSLQSFLLSWCPSMKYAVTCHVSGEVVRSPALPDRRPDPCLPLPSIDSPWEFAGAVCLRFGLVVFPSLDALSSNASQRLFRWPVRVPPLRRGVVASPALADEGPAEITTATLKSSKHPAESRVERSDPPRPALVNLTPHENRTARLGAPAMPQVLIRLLEPSAVAPCLLGGGGSGGGMCCRKCYVPEEHCFRPRENRPAFNERPWIRPATKPND